MKNNGMSTGAALFITLCIMIGIGSIMNVTEPKCIKSGCDNKRAEGSSYCYLHKGSIYDHTYKYSGSSSSFKSSSSSYSGSSSTYKSTSSTTKSSTGSASKSTSKSKSYDSYDDGYDAVYMDGDYDRYYSYDDYASGVDDTIEDDWEEDW